MNQPVKVKKLTYDNIKSYKLVLENLLQYSYGVSFPYYTVEQDYFENRINNLQDYLRDKKAIAIIALVNNEVAGFIWAFSRNVLDENRVHINHFVVSNRFQGLGIARKLHDEVKKYAVDNNIHKIELIVTADSPSVGFYEHLDYKIDRLQMITKV